MAEKKKAPPKRKLPQKKVQPAVEEMPIPTIDEEVQISSEPILRDSVPDFEKMDEELETAEPVKETNVQTRALKDRARRAKEERIRQEQANLARISSLNHAKEQEKVIWGKVTAIETILPPDHVEGDVSRAICAVIMLDGYIKVFIPFDDFYLDNPLNLKTVDLSTIRGQLAYYNRQKQVLQKTIGLEVPMIITQAEYDKASDTTSVLASRAKAALLQRHKYYIAPSTRMVKGDYYEATVISVGPQSLGLTLNGYDFVIPKYELTNKPINDLRSVYQPGDKVKGRLRNYKVRDGKLVSIEFNTIEWELEVAKSHHALVTPGRTVGIATITRIFRQRADGNITIYAWLNGYDIPVKIRDIALNSFSRELTAGEDVRIVVTGFLNSGYIKARCEGTLGGGSYIFRK